MNRPSDGGARIAFPTILQRHNVSNRKYLFHTKKQNRERDLFQGCARFGSVCANSAHNRITIVFFTNTQGWQCWHYCQLCVPIYLQFLFLSTSTASTCEIRNQGAHEDCILRLNVTLDISIFNDRAKTKLVMLAFLYCGEIVKSSDPLVVKQSKFTETSTPQSYHNSSIGISLSNKKVLLRERKRHTARRVVSTPSVVLPGYPPPPPPPGGGGGGTRTSVPPPPGGYPDLGTPPPPGGGPGTPPGCLMAFWEMLQSIMGYGYPPPCGQTNTCENSTFPSYYVRGR